MARILVINQYYAPDTTSTAAYLAGIAEHLACQGHAVRVVCGQPSYGERAARQPARELRNGVRIERVEVGARTGRSTMRTRVVGYLRFLTGATQRALAAVWRDRPELVITCHNPPPVPVLGALVARASGARFVYLPWDLHPDIVIATGFVTLPRWVERLWRRINRWLFQSAAHTVVLTHSMRGVVIGQGAPAERVEVVPLWPLEDGPASHDAPRRDDVLRVLYAGNMGVLHPLDVVLDAAGLLADDPVELTFVGEGARAATWRDRAEREGLARVRFLPRQAAGAFRDLLGASDVGLVASPPELDRLAFPSRVYTFLAAGKPLVSVGGSDSEVAGLVTRTGSGWAVGTAHELATLLASLAADPERVAEAGERARATCDRLFSRDASLRAYTRIVARLTRDDAPSRRIAGSAGPTRLAEEGP
jgi:glycosyltransferase involved in cell wall biosynthesis